MRRHREDSGFCSVGCRAKKQQEIHHAMKQNVSAYVCPCMDSVIFRVVQLEFPLLRIREGATRNSASGTASAFLVTKSHIPFLLCCISRKSCSQEVKGRSTVAAEMAFSECCTDRKIPLLTDMSGSTRDVGLDMGCSTSTDCPSVLYLKPAEFHVPSYYRF